MENNEGQIAVCVRVHRELDTEKYNDLIKALTDNYSFFASLILSGGDLAKKGVTQEVALGCLGAANISIDLYKDQEVNQGKHKLGDLYVCFSMESHMKFLLPEEGIIFILALLNAAVDKTKLEVFGDKDVKEVMKKAKKMADEAQAKAAEMALNNLFGFNNNSVN